MSTTDSSEESGHPARKRTLSADKLMSARVNKLTSALQDTNRNLQAVDQLLVKYKDLGEQKAANVDSLKADLMRNETRQGLNSRVRNGVRGGDSSHSWEQNYRLSGDHTFNRVCSPGRRRPVSSERIVVSDREFRTGSPFRTDFPRPPVRFFDDMDVGDQLNLHSLHRSIRDLSSEQSRLQQELEQERTQRQRLEIVNKRTIASLSQDSAGVADIKQLESLQSELRAERQLWRSKHEDLCKISAELKQALLNRQNNPIQSGSNCNSEPIRPFYDTLSLEDGNRQHWKTEQQTRIVSSHEESKDLNAVRHGNTINIQTLAKDLTSKELQLSRATRQLDDLQRNAEVSRQQMQDSITDLQQQLREAKARCNSSEIEKESLRAEVELAKSRIEEIKKQEQECLRLCKMKNKKLEKEIEAFRRNIKQSESKADQCEKDLETFRVQNSTMLQQLENLKRQFNDLLGIRVLLEEQVRAKDCELNQMKSVKLDLDSELRDCRAAFERLENELRSMKERVYNVTEEKNRMEDQFNSLQSFAFTSEHQLHSLRKELQDASINNSHMLAQMSTLTSENQELKHRVQEQQKFTFAEREEFSHLRQQLHQKNSWQSYPQTQQLKGNTSIAGMQALIRRLKTEYAECYAEMQTVKVALEEEKALSSRYKNQMDQLNIQLAEYREEIVATQQQYYSLRHQLLSSNENLEETHPIRRSVTTGGNTSPALFFRLGMQSENRDRKLQPGYPHRFATIINEDDVRKPLSESLVELIQLVLIRI